MTSKDARPFPGWVALIEGFEVEVLDEVCARTVWHRDPFFRPVRDPSINASRGAHPLEYAPTAIVTIYDNHGS